jgi:AcrR family transcriptional regulator
MSEAAQRRPGRPRSAESHQAIIRAVLELLVEDGFRSLTMEQVRARAGVGKATIYRRWSSKEELVRDAIVYLGQEFEIPDTGSFRGDYTAIATMILASAKRVGAATLMPRLLGEAVNDPDLHAIFYAHLVAPRRAALRLPLERAVERGELRDDVDLELAIDLLAGPIIYRLLISGGDLEQLFSIDDLLDAVLQGLTPRP